MKKINIAIILLIGVCLLVWKFVLTSTTNANNKSSPLDGKSSVAASQKSKSIDKKISNGPFTHFTDYQNTLERVFKSLATIDDLKKLTASEVHHTPEILKNGGELIGRIHDEADSDPAKRVDALNFFKRCAEDDQIAMAIRAVCLNKVYKLIVQWKIPVPLNETNIPRDLSELAFKLP